MVFLEFLVKHFRIIVFNNWGIGPALEECLATSSLSSMACRWVFPQEFSLNLRNLNMMEEARSIKVTTTVPEMYKWELVLLLLEVSLMEEFEPTLWEEDSLSVCQGCFCGVVSVTKQIYS